ncbi:MAG: porin [bacterium]
MTKTVRAAALAALAMSLPALATAGELEAGWSNGIRFKSEDGSVALKVGGRVQTDVVFQSADDQLEADLGDPFLDGNEFRRIRFYFAGVMNDAMEFKAQLDFAGGRAKVKDVWVGLRNLPGVGQVLIGHMYEPQGLDALTSDKYNTFVEKSLPTFLVAERRAGVRATNEFGKVWASAMVSRNSDDFGHAQSDESYNVIGRLAVAPVNEDGGRRLLHLGVSASRRNKPGEVEYSADAENHLAPDFVSTGALPADAANVIGVEGAFGYEQFGLQAEWIQSRIESAGASDATVAGFSVQASVFLTGEHRPYDTDEAAFGRVKPRENYDGKGAKGAWELAARFSSLDLDDSGASLAGGKLDDITVGLNWYLSPTFRWTANWVHADLDGSGQGNAVLFRFASDF